MSVVQEELPAAAVGALALDSPVGDPLVGGRVSKVWRCIRDGVPVAVRQSPGWRTLDEVAYEWDVLKRLRAEGAPVALPCEEPQVVEDHVWGAFEWIDGSHPVRPVADPAAYGQFLAELHVLTEPLSESVGQRARWCRVDQFMDHERTTAGLTLRALLSDFEAEFGARGQWLGRLAREVDGRLQAAGVGELPTCVAHGDFGPHQILVRGDDRVGALIDWDFTHLDLRVADLAIGTSLARPTVDRAVSEIGGYLRSVRLEEQELRLLPDLRRAFHLNNLGNWVCVLWASGRDIDQAVDILIERLEREQWWGPVLLEAVRRLQASPSPALGTKVRLPEPCQLTDLEVAHELADRAAVVAMHFFSVGVTSEMKSDSTPVTEADRAVEVLLREAIGELRPGDAILGEELGSRGDSERKWMIDPIDGTASFARADPNWRVQIALVEGDEILVAVVDSPALGIRWWASAGAGAFEGPSVGDRSECRRLSVSGTAAVRGAKVEAYPTSVRERLPADTVVPPTSRLALADLIRGDIDGYFVDCCGPWDHAPWILLVLEAGGQFTDHDGGTAPDRSGGLHSNGGIHAELLDALGMSRRPTASA